MTRALNRILGQLAYTLHVDEWRRAAMKWLSTPWYWIKVVAVGTGEDLNRLYEEERRNGVSEPTTTAQALEEIHRRACAQDAHDPLCQLLMTDVTPTAENDAVWISACSAHRAVDPDCHRCTSGHWVKRAAMEREQQEFRDDPGVWRAKVNAPRVTPPGPSDA